MGPLHQRRSSPTIIICRSRKSLLNFSEGQICCYRFNFELPFSFSTKTWAGSQQWTQAHFIREGQTMSSAEYNTGGANETMLARLA